VLYFNSCRKCETGTVELREGLDGPEFYCLNCSYTRPADTADMEAASAAA
jgi:hypothetical protein